MARLLAAEWRRFSRRRLNQAALLLLVLAVAWHFWSDYRQARKHHLLDDHAAELQRFRAMPDVELSTLPDADKWRWFTAQQVNLALPDTFGVAPWIWGGARAAWLLLAILAVSGEFQWGTARWLLSLGPGRVRWLLAKTVFLLLAALATVLLLWLAVALAGLCVHGRVFGSLAWAWATPRFWAGQAAGMLRAWLGFWPWVGLGVLLGMLSRTPVAGATLGALGLVLESAWAYLLLMLSGMSRYGGVALPRWLLPEGLLGQLYRWTVGYNVAALSLWAGDGRALAVALGYGLLAVGLAAKVLAVVLAAAAALLLSAALCLLALLTAYAARGQSLPTVAWQIVVSVEVGGTLAALAGTGVVALGTVATRSPLGGLLLGLSAYVADLALSFQAMNLYAADLGAAGAPYARSLVTWNTISLAVQPFQPLPEPGWRAARLVLYAAALLALAGWLFWRQDLTRRT